MKKIDIRWNKKGNIKVGAIWTYSQLYGSKSYVVPSLSDKPIKGTCGGHCAHCENCCYVKKSYRYDTVILGHARNTLAMRSDPIAACAELSAYITRARNKPDALRLHQSGEIESNEQLQGFCNLANDHKDKPFFVYTKAFDIVIPALLAGVVPNNLIVLISIWHEYGIAEFLKVAHLPNVKAFVYDDGTFDYAANGIEIQTYCKAYNEKGKLDHDITCDKCRKCFDNLACHKIIGCKAH